MSAPAALPAARTRLIAVAGNPNSGKSTLFNALTGLRQKVANYPGVTVEKREGRLRGAEPPVVLLDLPGSYSLSARAPDECIPRDVLLARVPDLPRPDGVLVVLDASNLERNLYLAAQLLELRLPATIVCNMIDRAESAGLGVDVERLSRELGVPVYATSAHVGRGVAALRQALSQATALRPPARRWRLPEPIEDVVRRVVDALVQAGSVAQDSADGAALLWLTEASCGAAEEGGAASLSEEVRGVVRGALDDLNRLGVSDLPALIVEARYGWVSGVVERCLTRGTGAGRIAALSDRIDRVLTHRALGLPIFLGLMGLMFLAIFRWAEPLMDGIVAAQEWLSRLVRAELPPGPLADLLADGVIAGAGSVIVFFPQICILFLCIALLEDSGYMARAAFLMDKLMGRIGLHGKSFIPLLSSFACAVPGIMATRTIENRRDRFTTILIAPLMSCSARLPVYLMVISVVFGDRLWVKTLVMFALYGLGLTAALAVAWLLKRTVLCGSRPPFIMELPPYHLPRPGAVLRTMWERSKLFLTQAGTVILAISVVLWALSYYPRSGGAGGLTGEQLRQSYLGRAGQAIEPVLSPLGFDWKIGVGVLASFAAREVFVVTMGTLYSSADAAGHVGDALGEEPVQWRARLRAERWESGPRRGQPVYSVASGLSIVVFYALCCQCISTLAVARRETNSWRWPAFMFSYMTALAYGAALATYQVAARLGYAAG